MYQLSDGQYHAGVHTDFPDLNVVNSTLHSPAPNIANAIRTRMGFHSVLYLVYCQLNMTNWWNFADDILLHTPVWICTDN